MTASALSAELLAAVQDLRPRAARLQELEIPAKLDRLMTAFAVQAPFYGRFRIGDGPRITARVERIGFTGRTIATVVLVLDLIHDGRPDQKKETIHVPLLELTEFLVFKKIEPSAAGDS